MTQNILKVIATFAVFPKKPHNRNEVRMGSFQMMTLFGSGDPEIVSGGIAQALVTTEMGLIVAIPALVLNALLMRRAKSYYNDLESFALSISQTEDVSSATSSSSDSAGLAPA